MAFRGKRRSAYTLLVLLLAPIAVGLWSQIRFLILPVDETSLDPQRVAVVQHFGTASSSSSVSGRPFQDDHCKSLRATILDGHHEIQDLGCIDKLAASMARLWSAKPIQKWCPSEHQPAPGSLLNATNTAARAAAHSSVRGEQGIILIKVPKSASSTSAGMVLHVSNVHSHPTDSTKRHPSSCPVMWEHALASTYSNRDTSRSFLLAPIRWPVARAMSDVYFHHVSLTAAQRRRRKDDNPPPTADGYIISQLRRIPSNFIVRYTTLQPWKEDSDEIHRQNNNNSTAMDAAGVDSLYQHVVQQILQDYDFLLVVDRLLESVVVLAHLTNTTWMDWMTVSSKTSGSWHRPGGHSKSNFCTRLIAPPPLETKPRIQTYIQEEWMTRHAGDMLLYHAANASLDRTIDGIGREWVQQHVKQAQAFQYHIQHVCANETFFPCSDKGVVQLEKSQMSCYARDFGCGHACVRKVAAHWGAGRTLE